MSQPLEGIRVVDLADESGALATRILADLGADVIMVEPPGGVRTRHLAPYLHGESGLDDDPGIERSLVHQYLDANKRSVVLDDERQPAFDALIRGATIVVSTRRGGEFDDRIRALNPQVIHASITPYGLDSEWADRSATDLIAGASGGLVWVSGDRKHPPLHGAANPSYTMSSLVAATGSMMALGQIERLGGPGLTIDVSMQTATAMTVMQTSSPTWWTWQGRVPGRPGMSNALRCADGGHVGLLVRPDRFAGFLAWLDEADITHSMTEDDWRWARVNAPREGNPVAAATLDLARKLSRDEFVDGALKADIVCLPVLGFPDMARHEQYLANDQFLAVHHEVLDRDLGFVRSPVDAMAGDVEIRRAPLLGEHTDAVLGELASPPSAAAPDPALRPPIPTGIASRAAPDLSEALAGVRVVDFGWVLAAPIGTRLLASFGAEVIRVESSAKPDSMRSQPGPDGKPDENLGGLYNSVNAGKLSLTVDLSSEPGTALVRELISTADVVVNNFRPGALERMGFGYDTLCGLRPDIILANLPGPHRHGPWSVRSSMGNMLMAASGFNLLMGFPDSRPRGVGVAYPDFTSPYLLVTTILAALRERRRTGAGQQLHLAQLSGFVSLLGVDWMAYQASGVQPPPAANRDPNHGPHGVYPAAGDDEWCAIAVEDDDQWRALASLAGGDGPLGDDRFASAEARRLNLDALDALVADWTSGIDKWTVASRCQALGVPAAPVENLADMYDRDPQLRHHYQIVHQPTAPEIDIPIDREAIQARGATHLLRRAPLLGEHNELVVREMLGKSEQEYLQLVVDGILT